MNTKIIPWRFYKKVFQRYLSLKAAELRHPDTSPS